MLHFLAATEPIEVFRVVYSEIFQIKAWRCFSSIQNYLTTIARDFLLRSNSIPSDSTKIGTQRVHVSAKKLDSHFVFSE
jgi:hypothetical protein